MSRLILHGDLSYCSVDEHLIFLDIHNDRYFRLPTDLEAALVKHLNGDGAPADSLRRLAQQKILVDGPSGIRNFSRLAIEPPTSSGMEYPRDPERASASAILGAISVVISTRVQLKLRRLESILAHLVSFRERQTQTPRGHPRADHDVLGTAAEFRHARLFVPVKMCCLLDSISLVRFLAKRGVHAHLVFGVTGEPFAAHCWAQHGRIVLNDTVGHAAAHTPIQVI